MKNHTLHKANILLIGCGYHARRIYFPVLQELEAAGQCQLLGIVDLLSQKATIQDYFLQQGCHLDPENCLWLSEQELDQTRLPHHISHALYTIVRRTNITGVIIATEPLYHTVYAQWAMRMGLHVLMDKPISTKLDISTSLEAVQDCQKDFEDLHASYISNLKSNPNLIFRDRKSVV